MEDKNGKHIQRGPYPKKLKDKVIQGLEVGRGDTKNIVPPDQVYELTSIGVSHQEIANFFDVTVDSIRRNFASELQKGKEAMKIRLRKAMFRNACELNSAAVQIFLSKNILGMSDSPVDSEANSPLPWREDDDAQVDIEEYDEQEDSEFEREDRSQTQ